MLAGILSIITHYGNSIFYRLCLPILVVFNKTDVESADKIDRWMRDYNVRASLCVANTSISMNAFLKVAPIRSLCLSPTRWPSHSTSSITRMPLIPCLKVFSMASVSVSSVTGEGTSDLFASIQASAEEYMTIYLPERKVCLVCLSCDPRIEKNGRTTKSTQSS